MRMSAYSIAIYPQRSPATVIETNNLCIIKSSVSLLVSSNYQRKVDASRIRYWAVA
jgi:hypothetical protein